MSESKRAQYMRGDLTFSEYYGLLVEYLGEDALRAALPVDHTPARWRKLTEADQHLNNIPLRHWDACDSYVRSLVQQAGGSTKLKPINGSGGWSLSDSVCVLKETARRYAKEG